MEEKIEGLVEEFFEPTKASYDWACPSGIHSVDALLGGGLPWGAVEIYGPPGSGKTTVGFEILVSAQQVGRKTALVASEYLDLPYAKKLGVDLDRLGLVAGGSAERALRAVEEFVREGPSVVVIDTATSLRPENDDRMNQAWVAVWTLELRRVVHSLQPKSCVVVINQVRQGKSLDHRKGFISEEHSAGKRLLDVFSTRLELRRAVSEDKSEMQVNVIRSPYSMPGCLTYVPMTKTMGVDTVRDLLLCAWQYEVVRREGSWYHFRDTNLGHGLSTAVEYLEKKPEMAADIATEVLSRASVR